MYLHTDTIHTLVRDRQHTRMAQADKARRRRELRTR